LNPRIPRRIIQSGKSLNLPLFSKAAVANVRLLNPDFEYMFFDDKRVEDFIGDQFPEYRSVFHSFRFRISRYDFFRYLAVYHFGGFYFDLDVFLASGLEDLLDFGCVFPFEELTMNICLRNEYGMDWEIGNYAFAAAPGHPFLHAVIKNCVRAQNDREWVQPMTRWIPRMFREEYYVLNTTGPGLVSRTLAEFPDAAMHVKVLFPENVCDSSRWHRFGEYGVHLQEGMWRKKRGYLKSRLNSLWESWTRKKLLEQSLRLGEGRCLDRGRKKGDENAGKFNSQGISSISLGTVCTVIEHDTSHELEKNHISVCICTFRRPEMLARALDGVNSQVTKSDFSYEVVVVDNDRQRSAEETVRAFHSNSTLKIIYDCEPEQNISLARNRAIGNATGNLLVFMDDDEFPVVEWLSSLYHAMSQYNADGVLGPVLPFFPGGAPQWLKKSNICNRRRLLTGTRLTNTRDTRTGNVLLKRNILPEGKACFNPAFGLTGGEDQDLFRKLIGSGRILVWCDEAEVYETVPQERWRASFHLRRHSRMGTLNGESLRGTGLAGLIGFLKSAFAVPVWLALLLLSFPLGKHVWMAPALRLGYSASCFLAYCGVSLIRYRD
jgi:hypothetical protein